MWGANLVEHPIEEAEMRAGQYIFCVWVSIAVPPHSYSQMPVLEGFQQFTIDGMASPLNFGWSPGHDLSQPNNPCANHHPSGETQINAAGTGHRKFLDCTTGQVSSEVHWVNGKPDGPFLVQAGAIKGQWSSGTPVGTWDYTGTRFGHQATEHVELSTDGTGSWAIPAWGSCDSNGELAEEGELVGGAKEGDWLMNNCYGPNIGSERFVCRLKAPRDLAGLR